MELAASTRAMQNKKESKRLRREGKIPAVLYVKGEKSFPLSVEKSDFLAALRAIPKGHLPTTEFVLKGLEGAERKVVVKDVQYGVTNYEVKHLDFKEILPEDKIKVRVPIVLKNTVDCQGVKLGGYIRMLLRHVQVTCAADRIPQHFELDVLTMQIGDGMQIKQIQLPEGVRFITNPNEVCVIVAKK